MRRSLSTLLLDRSDAVAVQFVRYAFVGAVAAACDMGAFYAANTMLGWHYLLAQTAGFAVGLLVNYALSVRWVFRSSGRVPQEIGLFVLIGAGGLLLSYALLWLLIDRLGLRELRNMVAKALTAVAVLAWNFGMRRQFVFASAGESASR
jgi:putative flippase GtrA